MATIPYWKLTRTPTARRFYEALDRLGVELVRTHRYAVVVDPL